MGTAAVTFDLDDTLVTLDRPREAVLEEAAASLDAPPLSRERYLEEHQRHHANATRTQIFAAMLEVAEDDATDADALSTAYREAIGRSLTPIPHVVPMLERIRADRPIGLVTNGPTHAQLDKLDRLGWRDRFDTVVISGRVGSAKPAIEPFLTACRRLEVAPADVVHVGNDPIQDIEGALNAGLRAILVADQPIVDRADVPVVAPHRLADELPRLLGMCADAR